MLFNLIKLGDDEGIIEMARWIIKTTVDHLTHLDKKLKLGGTEDILLVVEDDIACEVTNPLTNFSMNQLGALEEQEQLMVAGLYHFGLWLAVIPACDPMLIKTFLECYNELERQSKMLLGVVIQIDTEQVAKMFGLLIGRLAVANLKKSQFAMLPCLQLGTLIIELDA